LVIVEPAAGKLLGYWGTAKVRELLAVSAWPQGYRERSERQENSVKRMMDHGARKTNYGRQKMLGVDRHQQRAHEQRDHAREVAQQRVEQQEQAVTTQQATVRESTSKGHGTRLEQRQHTLGRLDKAYKDAQHHHDQWAAAAGALGPLGERADRDCRTQTILTVRTLLLEHALTSFMAALLGFLKTPVRLDCLLKLLFERSGARLETATQVVYWVNTPGVSVSYHRLLAAVVDGLWAMDVREQGKPLHVRFTTMPP
jgi:hypothetical protein